MVFRSILYRNSSENSNLRKEIPDFFIDLNLDQVMEKISRRWKDFDVKTWFLNPLQNEEDIKYRQDFFRDLENSNLKNSIGEFSNGMERVLRRLVHLQRLYDIQREGRFLETASEYCSTVRKLEEELACFNVTSEALLGFKDYLSEYSNSSAFLRLEKEIAKTYENLSQIKYSLTIKSGRVTVQYADDHEKDYTPDVQEIFSRFKEIPHKKSEFDQKQFSGEGHVQAQILKLIERLYPVEMGVLREFLQSNRDFVDSTILAMHNEVPFYLSYLDYISPLRKIGLNFSTPAFNETGKLSANDCFDLALAVKLCAENSRVVTNDFGFKEDERIIVVTGPNNGGKTTFSRTLGQMFYLASLGFPVTGWNVELAIPDRIFTHYERSENLDDLRSKLEDDLFRIKRIADRSSRKSVVIINEMLSSATVRDATSIGKRIIEIIQEVGSFCVFVTFIDEFTRYSNTVSMVAQIEPGNPEIRTFKVIRKPSDGLAYAHALARKYHVSYEEVKERLSNA